ncbi:13380_t:CDS:2, partial [Acaulospora morrowiae]
SMFDWPSPLPISVNNILLGISKKKLVWLLRATSAKGIFRHLGDEAYVNNWLSSVLRKDHQNHIFSIGSLPENHAKQENFSLPMAKANAVSRIGIFLDYDWS